MPQGPDLPYTLPCHGTNPHPESAHHPAPESYQTRCIAVHNPPNQVNCMKSIMLRRGVAFPIRDAARKLYNALRWIYS